MSRAYRVTLVVLLMAAVGMAGAVVWISRSTGRPSAWAPSGPVREIMAHPDVLLDEKLEVPADPGGCPGFTVPTPAESRFPPTRWDQGRSEATIPLGSGAYVMVVCMGRSADIGLPPEPEESGAEEAGIERLGVVAVRSAHGEGPAVTSRVGLMLLTDYFVERDGWVHAVGYLRPEEVGDAYLPVVETMLASWSWD